MLDLGKTVKDAVQKHGMLAWQYNTIGVSDAITMGNEGSLHLGFALNESDFHRDAVFASNQRDHC